VNVSFSITFPSTLVMVSHSSLRDPSIHTEASGGQKERLDFIFEAVGDRVSLAMIKIFLSIKLLEECSFI